MEFCTDLSRSTLEISVYSKECVFFSRCSYLKSLAYLKYDVIKDIDIFSYNYIDNLCQKSSSLCAVNCKKLSNKIENLKIGISKACNYNCYHCFNKNHVDTPRDKEIYFYLLNASKGHGFNSLTLGHQGEVFIYYDEIVNFLKTLSTKDFKQIIFQTNLSLLDDFKIKKLKEISIETGLDYVFLPTINGITPETHKAITNTDTFYDVMNNLGILLENFGPDKVKITFTIKEPNMTDLPNVSDFFNQVGIKYLNINYDLYDTSCKDLYLKFLNNGHLKCIYDTSCLEPSIKSKGLKKYSKLLETSQTEKQDMFNLWQINKPQNLYSLIEETKKLKPEKIGVYDSEDLLTIGITVHQEQDLSKSIIEMLSSCKKIQFIISNDAGRDYNNNLKEALKDRENIRIVYAKPGIENNRQNILNNTSSKYVYIIDYDDEIFINEKLLLDELYDCDDDIIMVNPCENGSEPDYIYHSDTQLFVTTWAQIFSTNFIRQVGGYIQTWNFYHEEFGTNANMLANIYSRNIDYHVNDIHDKEVIYYNHIIDESAHNSTLKRNVKDIIKFFKNVPKNNDILYKRLFLTIFKERISLMCLSPRDEKIIINLINKLIRKVSK